MFGHLTNNIELDINGNEVSLPGIEKDAPWDLASW